MKIGSYLCMCLIARAHNETVKTNATYATLATLASHSHHSTQVAQAAIATHATLASRATNATNATHATHATHSNTCSGCNQLYQCSHCNQWNCELTNIVIVCKSFKFVGHSYYNLQLILSHRKYASTTYVCTCTFILWVCTRMWVCIWVCLLARSHFSCKSFQMCWFFFQYAKRRALSVDQHDDMTVFFVAAPQSHAEFWLARCVTWWEEKGATCLQWFAGLLMIDPH